MSTTPHINQLREQLMQTLKSLRDRENPMETDRARAVAQVASVLVDSARVEVEYIKATGTNQSDFLAATETMRIPGEPSANNPFPTSVRHRLQG